MPGLARADRSRHRSFNQEGLGGAWAARCAQDCRAVWRERLNGAAHQRPDVAADFPIGNSPYNWTPGQEGAFDLSLRRGALDQGQAGTRRHSSVAASRALGRLRTRMGLEMPNGPCVLGWRARR